MKVAVKLVSTHSSLREQEALCLVLSSWNFMQSEWTQRGTVTACWVKASSYTRSWYCYTKSGHTVGSFRNWPQQAWPLAAWLWSCFKKLCSLYRKLAGCKIYWNKIRMLCQPRCTTWDLDWQRRAQPAQLRDAVLAARKNWMRIQLFFFFFTICVPLYLQYQLHLTAEYKLYVTKRCSCNVWKCVFMARTVSNNSFGLQKLQRKLKCNIA